MEISKSKNFINEIFGNLTVFRDDNNSCWFIAYEVAEKLGYKDVKDAISRHCKGGGCFAPLLTKGGIQQVKIINEPDFYRLIFNSKLDGAIKFQDWVFEEVLPQIRMLGLYATDDVIEKALTDRPWGLRLLMRMRDGLNKPKPKTQSELQSDFKALTGIEVK